jgi:uncharacterized membrane protein YphA (DoxX/SURF4 family)
LAAGSTVIFAGATQLLSASALETSIVHLLAIAAGIFLVLGLWTPIAGLLLAILQMWAFSSLRCDLWTRILLATLGAGLALLGPGAFSIDARLFGWKRIDFGQKR